MYRVLHATMDMVSKTQSMHVSRVELGIDFPDEGSPVGMKAVEQMFFHG